MKTSTYLAISCLFTMSFILIGVSAAAKVIEVPADKPADVDEAPASAEPATEAELTAEVEPVDWEVKFDTDKAMAAETRRRVLGMVASERMPMIGYHMPFPAVGFVETAGDDGFRWVPESYQLML